MVDSTEEPSPEEVNKKNTKIGFVVNTFLLGLMTAVSFATNTLTMMLVSVGVNWFVFLVHGLPFNSEKFFDATGTLTYTVLSIAGLLLSPADFGKWHLRQIVLSAMVLVWTLRLGFYLLGRIMRDGKDSRFDDRKTNCLRWLGVWTFSAAWCYLIALPVLIVCSKTSQPPSPSIHDYVGWSIWGFGFLIEVVADTQKDAFRRDPANSGKFITTGLWGYSRHPNYFGEITLWVGVVVSASAVLRNWDWLALLSPLTTYLLLTKVSGLPLLEEKGKQRWGHDPAYMWYIEKTPSIIPMIPRPPPFDPASAAVQMNA